MTRLYLLNVFIFSLFLISCDKKDEINIKTPIKIEMQSISGFSDIETRSETMAETYQATLVITTLFNNNVIQLNHYFVFLWWVTPTVTIIISYNRLIHFEIVN